MAVKIEEKLDNKEEYAIFINNKEVFSVKEKENIQGATFRECLNVPVLLKQVYDYGREGKEIIFGIRDVKEIGKDI